MIRILQMPVRDAKGGITQYALRNWSQIDQSRFCFDWVTLDKSLSFESGLLAQGCKVHYLSCRQEEDEARFRQEMMRIFENGYDAVHLHTSYWRGFLAEELAIQAGIQKIIVHAHSTGIDVGEPTERNRLLKAHNEWKRQFSAGLATHFVACSASAADFLFGQQIPPNRIQILRNAIDTNLFAYDEALRDAVRKKLGVENRFVLLQSGRLVYQKNFAFTLDVFAEYIKQNPNAVLLIAGDGDLRAELEALAHPLGESVRFLGFRNDIHLLLQAADVFLQPSLFEGFSIASIEAQCSGIPWLVSNAVPEAALPLRKAALPLRKAALPLEKVAWLDMLAEVEKKPSRDKCAANQLKTLGWDLDMQVKVLEGLYDGGE